MLVSAWHVLTDRKPYRELGGDYFDRRKKDAKISQAGGLGGGA